VTERRVSLEVGERSMNSPQSDRNLFLGIVALQMDFIARDALIEAMHQWTLDKPRSLAEILERNGALDAADRVVLENLVERHIARHGGDPQRSLSSIAVSRLARSKLESLGDCDVEASLGKLVGADSNTTDRLDPDATSIWRGELAEHDSRYRILHLHNTGGLGTIFKAEDREVKREVALKQMKEEIASDRQCRSRFIFEAEITGNLEHPGIVPVYGVGQYSDGRPYYAMRFIDGKELREAVGEFHTAEALKSDAGARQREFQGLLRRFLTVCDTMAYAHSRGVIHRDLKPRNIMLGPFGETLVVDWGVAKVVGRHERHDLAGATLRPPSSSDLQQSLAGSQIGTPEYMSPEQAFGDVDHVGLLTDIYSLGATLYFMLTGRAPFAEQERHGVLPRVKRGEFPRPSAVNDGVDRALEAICLKAMSLRQEDRYPSCRALAEDIEHYLADQPVTAYPEPLSTRVGRWLRQRRQWVAAAAVIVLLGLLGLAIHDWRLGQEQVQTRHARDEAAAQLTMTRSALRKLFYVAGTKLANIPQAYEFRSEIAGDVRRLYETLREKYPSDPDIQLELARVYVQTARLAHFAGRLSDAEADYERSIEILERLVSNPSQRRAAGELLARTLTDRGDFYHLSGHARRAELDLLAAVTSSELLASESDQSTYLEIEGGALVDLAEILLLLGKPAEAFAQANAAVELLGQAAATGGSAKQDDRATWLLAMALTDRGDAAIARDARTRDSASADYDRAIELAESLGKESDYFTSGRLQLATALTRRGEAFLAEPPDRERAKQAFDQAIAVIEPLASAAKSYAYFREALAASFAGRARLNFARRRIDEAAHDCTRSQSLWGELLKAEPSNPDFLSGLADVKEIASDIAMLRANTAEAKALLDGAMVDLERALSVEADRAGDVAKLTRCKQKWNRVARGATASP
jgi:eukaryotic-like serine/threonine-protein kinase